jgi:putative FmdB family regulatory protein
MRGLPRSIINFSGFPFDLAPAQRYRYRFYILQIAGVTSVPIYEYQCTRCGEVFEAFQKMNDKPLNRCKFCRGKVDRLISQSSFQLRGSGWYLTDYAGKSKSASTSEDSGATKTEKSKKTDASGRDKPSGTKESSG